MTPGTVSTRAVRTIALALAVGGAAPASARNGFDVSSTSPVDVIDAESLGQRADKSVTDLLKDLPIGPVPGGGAAPGVPPGLRGLGTDRTLVLINGRRPESNSAGAIDLSTIPSTLIDRVEVLRDGSRSVYGSDAVGGVVNVILKKDVPFDAGDGGSAMLGDVYGRLGDLTFGFDADAVCDFGAGAPSPYNFLWSAPPSGLPKIDTSGWTWTAPTPGTPPAPTPTPTDPGKSWPQTPTGGEPAAPGGAASGGLPKAFDGWKVPPWSLVERTPECPADLKSTLKPLYDARDQARADWAYFGDFARQPNRAPSDQAADQAKADEARAQRESLDERIRTLLAGCAPGAKPDTSSAAAPAPSPSGDAIDTLRIHVGPSFKGRLDYYPYAFDTEWSLPGPGVKKDTTLGAGEGPVRATPDGGTVEYRFSDLGLDPLRIPSGLPKTSAKSDWSLDAGIRLDWGARSLDLKYDYAPREQVVVELGDQAAGAGDRALGQLPDAVLEGIPRPLQRSAWQGYYIGEKAFLTFGWPESQQVDTGAFRQIPGYVGHENDACAEEAMPALLAAPAGAGDWAARAGLGDAAPAGGAPIVVGVIDTGIDWSHLDLDWSSLWRNEDEVPGNRVDDDRNGYVDDVIGWDFVGSSPKPWDYDGHGTFVAGIIAASAANGAGATGVNPGVKLMVLKALNGFGHTRASSVAQAIAYGADNGAKILNLSLAGEGLPRVVQQAVAYAEKKGVLVIVAAGNEGKELTQTFPAALPGVMTVAATDASDRRAAFSNHGEAVSIAAPGTDIVSLRARRTDFQLGRVGGYRAGQAFAGGDRRYYRSSGTSFAAPIVAGVASLVWSKTPALGAAEVRQVLEQTARDVETPGRDLYTGFGIVDARAALAGDVKSSIVAEILDANPVQDGDAVLVEVTGSAKADRFRRAWLEIGEGESPSSWKKVGAELTSAVEAGALGRIPASELSGAQVWTVRLVVEHEDGKTREARYVLRLG